MSISSDSLCTFSGKIDKSIYGMDYRFFVSGPDYRAIISD